MPDSELPRALDQATGCLFLCSGNMIRSAFAELYARHLDWSLPVRSAGTCYPNSRIHPKARAALLQRGVNTTWIDDFRPRLIGDLNPAPGPGEIVIGMKTEHLREAQSLPGQGFLLLEALGESGEVADPYFEGGFDEVFALIARAVEALVD